MKVFFLALFVAAAVAAPLEDGNGEPVELIVNGVADGQPLEISDVLDIKVKEHVNGEVAAVANLLHPYTAQGLAEAAAAEEAVIESNPVDVISVLPVVVPESDNPLDIISVLPVIVSEPDSPLDIISVNPVNVPEPDNPLDVISVLPNPQPIVVPEPVLVEEGPIVPGPVQVVESPEFIPEPAAQIPTGEIFNDGNVQVVMNTSEEPGLLSTLQSWFNMAINYISNGVQTTQQIV